MRKSKDAHGLAAAIVSALALLSIAAAHADTNLMVGVKNNMQAVLIAPDGPGPFPGVLVLHTSGGLREADITFARNLTKEGYVTLVPAFMLAYGLNAGTRRETFTKDAEPIYADLVAALGTLARDPHVAGQKLAAVGFSNGGYFAMWLAATGKVQAGVSYYGALSGAGSDKGLSRFRSAFNKSSSPVLILHGLEDETVPVVAARNLGAVVEGAGSPVELHLYDGAGHRFDRTPGSPQDAAASADAWPRTLAFFAKYLKQR
jgi:carboxymethylenebutenolidase